MIITLAGKPGSGKSTIAKLLAEKLKLKHYSTGDFMRQMAKERGMTLEELSKIAETDKSIDEELDERQRQFGKKENGFVIDGRLAWHFIPHSVKIFLECSPEVSAKRIFSDKSHFRKSTEKQVADINEVIEKIKFRMGSENKRYRKLYGIEQYDHKNYDLVIDTSSKTKDEIIKCILDFLEKGKVYK